MQLKQGERCSRQRRGVRAPVPLSTCLLNGTNFIHVHHQESMPQVIIGRHLIAGSNSLDELSRRVENELGLKRAL